MKNQFLLIATHRRGFETDPVIDGLRERNIPVFRYNCEAGCDVSEISIEMDKGTSRLQFICDGRKIGADDIVLGWYQQSPPFLGQPADATHCLQQENILAVYQAALYLLKCRWFNAPAAVHLASNKVLQLAAAAQAGLATPMSCIGNNPEAVRMMCEGGTTIAKNLATPWIDTPQGGTMAAYTKLVDSSWLQDDGAIRFCPVIYQRFHERKCDYRVVVVADRAFAAVCSPNEEQRVDIRRGELEEHGYQPCNFPSSCLDGLRKVMRHFGTDYCSADFMQDQDGNMYFLDLNSCGAWWWVDQLYGGEICTAIVDRLAQLYAVQA